MATPHVCYVDCKPVSIRNAAGLVVGKGHQMYASQPTSAAGRYQWEQNQRILRMGRGARVAWRATGQGESREIRKWNEDRRAWYSGGWRTPPMHGIRRAMRALRPDPWQMIDCSATLLYNHRPLTTRRFT